MLTGAKKKVLVTACLLLVVTEYLVMDRRVAMHQTPLYFNHSIGQQERINRVNYVCTNKDFASMKKDVNISIRVIYGDKYKLAYISVPKTGSTFLKKLFYVLKFGIKNAHTIFNKMRLEVHAMTGELVTLLNSSDFERVITLIPARNPYTRLYSAYIDKVFLPLSVSLGKNIIHENAMMKLRRLEENSANINTNIIQSEKAALKQQLTCTKDITFQDFLDFALTEPLRGKSMFDHFCPISLLLSNSVCRLKHILIIKQETFVEDIIYVLKLIKVEDSINELFHNEQSRDRAASTILSVVETTYMHARMQREIGRPSDCWTMPLIAERLWRAFQIQGIINEESKFPKYSFSEKSFHDSGYLIKVMLDEVKMNPVPRSQTQMQRKLSVQNAYKNISKHTIKKIQDTYAVDFQMFGYDTGQVNI